MKSNHQLAILTFFALMYFSAIPTFAAVTVNISSPTQNQLIGQNVSIAATASSTYEITSVLANIEGRTVQLTYSANAVCNKWGCSPGWAGSIDLSGIAEGSKTLTVTATDHNGDTGSKAITIIYDNKPSVTVAVPLNESVATPIIHVTASCTDTVANCTSLNVYAGGTLLTTGTNSIDQDLSLEAYNGQIITLNVIGTDSKGQTTTISRSVYVEASGRLHKVVDAPGVVWDYSADGRVLFFDTTTDINKLKIANTSNGTTTSVLEQPGKIPQYGLLTPLGAIYDEKSPDNLYPNFTYDALYDFSNGSTFFLDIPQSKPIVSGNYAAWCGYDEQGSYDYIYLRNLLSGITTAVVKLEQYKAQCNFDLSLDGDVVYQIGEGVVWDVNIMRYNSGSTTRITNDIGAGSGIPLWYMNKSPKTDGSNIAYIKQEYKNPGGYGTTSLYLKVGIQEVLLSPPFSPERPFQYQLNNGWTAYTKPGSTNQAQIWLRSPTGTTEQVTFFSASSSIVSLSTNGEVFFSNGGKHYFYSSAKGVIEISTSLPEPIYLNNSWYGIIGRSIFSIDTNLDNIAAATHFTVSVPASVTAGSAFNFTVTALDQYNNFATGYSGTVHFASSDAAALLPANATLTNGTGTFAATLNTVGNRTITATDTVTATITGTSGNIGVNAAAATHFTVSAPASVTAGSAFNFTVTALDQYNNFATGYSGTVHFTSNDAAAALPADATLANGTGTFPATLTTTGSRTITATDTVTVSITGTSNAIATNAAPSITSANSATFIIGAQGTFTVTATGFPIPALSQIGALPGGVTFIDNGNGTATLSGTPAVATNGVHHLTFTAHNSSAPDATQSFTLTVNFDPGLPLLTVSTLPDGSVTNIDTLNVSGNATSSNGIQSVTCNGAVSADGIFSFPVQLVAGPNIITIVATDNAGQKTTDTRTITLDQTAPLLTITAPADNSKIAKAFVDVTGTVDVNSSVSVNGSTAGVAMNGMGFSSTVNLVSGLNTVAISATNLAGNTTSAKRSVTSDTAAPSLAVTDPAQDITTNQAGITIQGTVSDALTAITITITADGQTYTPQVANGGFTQAITLTAPNTYAVIVTATDKAGNQTSVQRNIIYVQTATGDINGDGEVTIGDALLALRVAVGVAPMDNKYLANGDVAPFVNGKPAPDGNITISDALMILRKSVGLINW